MIVYIIAAGASGQGPGINQPHRRNNMKSITALDLRKKLGSVLDSVAVKHEPVTITRANKPLAVIISADKYQEKILKGDRGRKLKELSAKMDAWKKEHRKETAGINVVKAVREARERR
jgi:prevent-host-death family protein